jgi:hypothetical protein
MARPPSSVGWVACEGTTFWLSGVETPRGDAARRLARARRCRRHLLRTRVAADSFDNHQVAGADFDIRFLASLKRKKDSGSHHRDVVVRYPTVVVIYSTVVVAYPTRVE